MNTMVEFAQRANRNPQSAGLARAGDRPPKAGDREAAADAVRAELGKSPRADRSTGVAARGTGSDETRRERQPSAGGSCAYVWTRTDAAPTGRSSFPRDSPTRTERRRVPGLRGKLRKLGEDVSEVLEYVPEHFKVIRPKLSCAVCERIV
jgi:hypothetical protein